MNQAVEHGIKQYTVLVVGGGTGGISVAARLKRLRPALNIGLIEPSEYHYYQPAWTLVGGGCYEAQNTRRRTRDCVPAGVDLIGDRVEAFEPEQHRVVLQSGARIGYSFLVVAAGIQLDWNAIAGLNETLGQNGVTSNYRYDLAPYTWQCIRQFRGGAALFTQPPMPIKCAGAPQKILYLAADALRKRHVAAELRFLTPGATMFGVPFYAKALDKVMAAYDARPSYGYRLIAVDGAARKAVFEVLKDGTKTEETLPFELLHVVPPQSAPAFIRNSALADTGGWLEVDKATLQHLRYPDIFGLGDCTSTPNSKTAAAVKNQAPVLVTNLLQALDGAGEQASYDGYASCPLTTSAGKVMLAEFCYDGVVAPSFSADPRRPRRFYWWLKRTFLPYLYWNILLKGRRWPIVHKPRSFSDTLPPIEP